MKAKYLVLIAALIATLAAVSVISDDSAAEYEEYVVFGPHNNYSDDFTKFSLKAGTVTINFDPYSYYYVELIVGGEPLNYGYPIYVPYDTDDAYFYCSYDDVSTIRAEIINTPDDYDVKGKLYSGYYSDYSGNTSLNASLIELDPGTYTFKFSRNGDLCPLDEGSQHSFKAGVEKTITVDEAGRYYYRHDYYGNSVSGPLPVYCSMSPGSLFDDETYDVDMTKVTTSTTYRWYKQTISLDSGTHYINSSNKIFVFDDLQKAEWFENNIIRNGITQPSFYSGGYGELEYPITLDSTTTLYVYSQDSSLESNNDIRVGENSFDVGEMIVGGDQDSIYLLANTVSRILVEYDHSKYRMFLSDSSSKILLTSGVMMELNNTVSKQYWICVESIIYNSMDCYTAEYMLYTEGIPESDNLAPLFAVVTISICAVFFGLLLVSGRKPKWDE